MGEKEFVELQKLVRDAAGPLGTRLKKIFKTHEKAKFAIGEFDGDGRQLWDLILQLRRKDFTTEAGDIVKIQPHRTKEERSRMARIVTMAKALEEIKDVKLSIHWRTGSLYGEDDGYKFAKFNEEYGTMDINPELSSAERAEIKRVADSKIEERTKRF